MRRLILAAVMLVSACGSQPGDSVATGSTSARPGPTVVLSTEPTEPQGLVDELEAARATWTAAALDTYTYRFLDDCGECDQLPVQSAVVWKGEVLDALRRAASVEQAFALIDGALAEGVNVEVSFDPELGYPTDLWIDREARAYDGGTHLVFSALEPGLPGDPTSLEEHRKARIRWEDAAFASYQYSSAVICDCEFQVSMRTTVVDGRVTAFDYRTPEPTDITFSPLTISQMFDDVESFLSGEDFPDEGISVRGYASYDARFGYPNWIGLEIDVTDPHAAAEVDFPHRLVMTVSDLTPLALDPENELDAARARWASAGLDNYTYDITVHDVSVADYTDTFTVTVEQAAVVAVTQNGYEYPPEDVRVPTIEEVFEALVNWRLAGLEFDVIYDVELGYPAVVITDEPGGSLSISLHR